jgi:hypothetical protein
MGKNKRSRTPVSTITIDPGVASLGAPYVTAATRVAELGGRLEFNPATRELTVTTTADMTTAPAEIFAVLAKLVKDSP